MASSLEFVQYVAEQLRDAGEITYRKMFGEYGVYGDGKIFALVCDDQFFVKITEAGRHMATVRHLPEASPYEGAKPYFLIEDVDDRDFLTDFVTKTCRTLPEPKQKKQKKAEKKAGEASRERKKEKAFDYKKEYREFYMPPKKPQLVEIPPMNFIAVKGEGDPNEEGGAYQRAIGLLYGIAFTIKMSYKGTYKIDGYFPYVVPPLEGLWRQDNGSADVLRRSGGIDFSRKQDFQWISMIRLPEFVTEEVFGWAVKEASEKKKSDFSDVKFFTYDEGLCVQCMHVGSYDDEPETVGKMSDFTEENEYEPDFSSLRAHHEIYLSDPRRTAPDKRKTVIRIPVRKKAKSEIR